METSPPSPPLSAVRLWSPRQIATAGFLGSRIAAAWFFLRNYVALGDQTRGRRAIWIGLGATAALILLGIVLPEKFPIVLLPAISGAAIQVYASNCFGAEYDNHIAKGGFRGSWWTVIGIGIGAPVVLIAIAAIIVYSYAWWIGARIVW